MIHNPNKDTTSTRWFNPAQRLALGPPRPFMNSFQQDARVTERMCASRVAPNSAEPRCPKKNNDKNNHLPISLCSSRKSNTQCAKMYTLTSCMVVLRVTVSCRRNNAFWMFKPWNKRGRIRGKRGKLDPRQELALHEASSKILLVSV